jgi:hypothetical protein
LDLSKNPSALTGELIFAENALDYGLYEFQFSINLTSISGIFQNSIRTYARIVPSGVIVFALENGMNEIKVGSNQRFFLKPAVYSYDLDNLIPPSQLNFTYYCQVVRSNSKNQNVQNQIDLETFKINNKLLMNRNETCFGLNSNFFFFVFLIVFLLNPYFSFKVNMHLIQA